MGRHQTTSSAARARVALSALPLVATVGATGIGSMAMSPVGSEAPLEPSAGGGAGGITGSTGPGSFPSGVRRSSHRPYI